MNTLIWTEHMAGCREIFRLRETNINLPGGRKDHALEVETMIRADYSLMGPWLSLRGKQRER